jgi:cyclase
VAAVAARLGSCATVVNIDPKRVVRDGRAVWEVFVNGGRVPTGLEAVAWARRVEELGAGEIVLTCMDRDGTREGYDLEMTAAVSRAVGIPVVASGGAGRPEHLADAVQAGGADAALAAGIFHFRQCTIREVKDLFARRGIPVRPAGD